MLVYKNEQEIETMLKNKSGKARFAEIRNLCKTVTYCQQANYGCGAQVPKIKETKTKTETKPKSQKQQKIAKKEEKQVNLVSEVLPRRKAAIKPAGFYRLCNITV